MSFHIKCTIQIKGAPQTSKHAHKSEVIASLSLRLLLLISSLTALRQSFLLAYHGVLGRCQLAGYKIRMNNADHYPSKQQDRFILVIHRAIMMKIILFCRHESFKVKYMVYYHLLPLSFPRQNNVYSGHFFTLRENFLAVYANRLATQENEIRFYLSSSQYQNSLLKLPKLFQKNTCFIASLATHGQKVAVMNEKKKI